METDISRAAKGFAEDATNIKYRCVKLQNDTYRWLWVSLFLVYFFQYSIEFEYFSWNISSWRNEKATFKEKLVEIATEKVKGKNEGYDDKWEYPHGSK